MINFTYYSPTKIIFGKDAENAVGEEARCCGATRALIHFGGGSAKKSGLLDRVAASLDAAGVDHVSLGGVQPNPRLGLVREGIALCKREGVDFILAVGGGSVIDSAKAISYGIANPFDVWELFTGTRTPEAFAPVGCVPTIAAAGSEASYSTVITDEAGNDKRAYNNDISRPAFAALNPELTYTLPEYQSMAGAVDILMHTMERYFTDDSGDLVDRMSEGLMKCVMEAAPRVGKNPRDYDARAELMWAGSLSHNGLTGVGRLSDFASHQLEHELSGMFDVAHGAGLSAIWPSWARYVYRHNIARFAQFAVRVMGCEMDFGDPEATAIRGIDAMEAFFRSIGMPVSIAELGIPDLSDAQIDIMVDKCSRGGTRTVGNFVRLDGNAMRRIYEMAR